MVQSPHKCVNKWYKHIVDNIPLHTVNGHINIILKKKIFSVQGLISGSISVNSNFCVSVMLPWPSLPRLRDSKHFRTLPGIKANLLLGMRFSFLCPTLPTMFFLQVKMRKMKKPLSRLRLSIILTKWKIIATKFNENL